MSINIPTVYFRSSSLGNWEFCEMQYFIQYVLGYKSPANKKAQLGTITHKTMEILANCKKQLQDDPDKGDFIYVDPELDDISWDKWSLFKNYFVEDLCRKSFEYYRDKCIHNYEESDFDFCYKMCRVLIDNYGGVFDPRYRNILDPEPFFDIPIEESWAKFNYEGEEFNLAIKGTIDLVTKLDEDTIEVIDYKSGQRKDWATGELKDYNKLMKDTQLLLYNYAISKLYPQYKNRILTIIFLRDGGPFSLTFDEEEEQEFLKRLKGKFYDISKTRMPKLCSQNRSNFKCTRLCHYYKTNFPGTNKSICEHVEDNIKTYGIKIAQKELKVDGFNSSSYQAPGTGN